MAIGQLLVIGATSPTGQIIVKRGIELGWKVTVLGRRTLPEHASNPDIRVSTGDLCNMEITVET